VTPATPGTPGTPALGTPVRQPASGEEEQRSFCRHFNGHGNTEQQARENSTRYFNSLQSSLNGLRPAHTRANIVVPQNEYLAEVKKSVDELCSLQRVAGEGMRSFSQRIAEQERQVNEASCGQISDSRVLYGRAESALALMSSKYASELERLGSGRELFNKSTLNKASIERWGAAQAEANAADLRASIQALKREFLGIWGQDPDRINHLNYNFSISDSSFFGQILKTLEQEKLGIETDQKLLTFNRTKLEGVEERCRTLRAERGRDTRTDPAPDAPPTADPPPADTGLAVTERRDLEERLRAETTLREQRDRELADLRNRTPPPPASPPPSAPAGKSFLAENKNLLIVGGAGAAAVGGILYYKNQQDKKAKNKAWDLESDAAVAVNLQQQQHDQSGSSSSVSGDSHEGGTPVSNATPPGSTLAVSGIPSGVSSGNTLSTINVSILDPKGILTQDSMTEISVSCETPSPCSLTGTLSVTSQKGKAAFSDLRFNAAHKGVKLRISAPGFQSVVSSPFDVN
jgi:hypothetical protein